MITPPLFKSLKPVLWTHPITMLGLLTIVVGILMLVTFWLFLLVVPQAQDNQYLGVMGFMMLPNILVGGLMMCPVGVALQKRKFRKDPKFKSISVRTAVTFLAITFFLIVPVLGVCSYRGYQFTETAEFCGTICHNMSPHYTRYRQSPHARVTCPGCHIGPGAEPFIRSKINGMKQVVYTALNEFPRPIPCAITQLRPARETCEECHWPSQFFGSLLRKTTHFAPDEKNTRHDYAILVKVGGLNNALGVGEGIHMHMLDRIEYVSDDPKLQHITWVRYRYPDGKQVVFRSDGQTGDAPPQGKKRTLDCIDCHNIIGHEFQSPEHAVDHALSVGQLDSALPFIKRQAVIALAQNYKSRDVALSSITQSLETFYRGRSDVWPARQDAVQRSIQTVQTIYNTQFFPEMNVDWRTYPSNVGHMESPGCFRCHDGLHVSDQGKRISSDCTSCHTFQYRQDDPSVIVEKKFEHPLKINNAWKDLGPHEGMLCTDCHDGGLGAVGWNQSNAIYTCGDCHPSGRWLNIRDTLHIRQMAATQPSSASRE